MVRLTCIVNYIMSVAKLRSHENGAAISSKFSFMCWPLGCAPLPGIMCTCVSVHKHTDTQHTQHTGKEKKNCKSYWKWRHKDHWPEQSGHPSQWQMETQWVFCPCQDYGQSDTLRLEGGRWRPPLQSCRQKFEIFLRAIAALVHRL